MNQFTFGLNQGCFLNNNPAKTNTKAPEIPKELHKDAFYPQIGKLNTLYIDYSDLCMTQPELNQEFFKICEAFNKATQLEFDPYYLGQTGKKRSNMFFFNIVNPVTRQINMYDRESKEDFQRKKLYNHFSNCLVILSY